MAESLQHLAPQKRAVLMAWKAKSLTIVEEDGPPNPPSKGNVLIRIESASVQSTDLLMRTGTYPQKHLQKKPPMTLGYDFVGEVVAVGQGVEDVKLGDVVGNLCIHGAHARYIEQRADRVVKVPDGLDHDLATAAILSWTTAYQMLYRTKARKAIETGEPIFIQGGAGQVASCAIQLAVLAGCKVYTTARKAHHDKLRDWGADPYDYTDNNEMRQLLEDVGRKGVSASFDGVGADKFKSSKAVLKGKGAFVMYGVHGQLKSDSGLSTLGYLQVLGAMLPLVVSPWTSFEFYDITDHRASHEDNFRDDLSTIFDMIVKNQVEVKIAATIGFEQIDEYHQLLMNGGLIGKIILNPNK